MKKERKLKLEVKKINISKLNSIIGGNDPITSVDFPCAETVDYTIIGINCRTGDTRADRSLENCIGVGSGLC
jgi:hypothetical protein